MKKNIPLNNKTDVQLINKHSYLLLFISLIYLFILIYFCKFGFDLTDEAQYLNWYHNPYEFSALRSFYGHFLSLIYWKFDKNIVSLRIFNILFTYILGIFAVRANLIFIEKNNSKANSKLKWTISIILASLTFSSIGVFTPSYNDLTLWGCLIFGISLPISKISNFKKGNLFIVNLSKISPFLFLISFYLIANAKLTTFVILAVPFFAFIYFFKIFSVRKIILFISFFIILFGISISYYRGGLISAFNDLSAGKDLWLILGAGYDFTSLIKSFSKILPLYLLSIPIALFQILCWNWFKNLKFRNRDKILFVLYPTSVIIIFIFLFRPFEIDQYLVRILNLGFFTLWIMGLALSGIIKYPFSKFRSDYQENKSFFSTLLLFLIPIAFGFGSNNDYVIFFNKSSIFFILTFIALHKKDFSYHLLKNYHFFISILLITLVLLSTNISNKYINPYREPGSFLINTDSFYFDKSSVKVYLDKNKVNYLEAVKSSLYTNGFNKNDLILDLSGQSPGLIYAFNGTPIGFPWIVGGYKGSYELAEEIMRKIPCSKIEKAWLIIEENGPRSINLDSILDLIDTNNYEKVFEIDFPDKTGNWGQFEGIRRQSIYKPIKSNKFLDNCINN